MRLDINEWSDNDPIADGTNHYKNVSF